MGKAQAQSEHPTFETVWAMFQESKKEADRRKEEFDREMKKRAEDLELEMKKRAEDLELEMKKRKEEDERRQEKVDREMEEIRQINKENDKKMGYLNNRFGEMVEHLVAPSIKEKFRDLGFTFDHVSKDHEITDNGRSLAEIDLLLENGDIAMVVEVKSKPVQKDVDEHIHRMEILANLRRKKADAKNDRRKYQGAIAGAIMGKEVRNYAHKKGFYVIEQTGDTVRINIPEGFKPRVW